MYMSIAHIEILGIAKMDIVTVNDATVSNLTLTHSPKNNKKQLKEFCHTKQGEKTKMKTKVNIEEAHTNDGTESA